jgi:hypothetical protein
VTLPVDQEGWGGLVNRPIEDCCEELLVVPKAHY